MRKLTLPKNPDFSLILPCYNEERILMESVRMIESVLSRSGFSYEVIFIDDQSSDATVQLLTSICAKRKHFRLMRHMVNIGRGQSVSDGIMEARGEIVGYIDIDCEVSPVYIPQMVNLIIKGKTDMVIGKRIYRTTVGSIGREVLSRGYAHLVSRILLTGGLDTESGYKFFSRKKILPILEKTSSRHWFWDTEITVYALREGLRIVEMPVLYLRRFDKRSTVRVVPDTWEYLKNVVRLKRRLGKS